MYEVWRDKAKGGWEMKHLLNAVSRLLSLSTRMMGGLRAISTSPNCETCREIIETTEKDYLTTMEKLFSEDNNEEGEHDSSSA